MKYLIDTCIWIDLLEDRVGKKGEPFGRYASKFILKIIKNKETLLINKEIFLELRKSNIINLFLRSFIILVDMSEIQYLEAKMLSKERNLPLVDCMSCILARDNNTIVITRDKHILHNLKDIVKSSRPEEVK